jgi:hypothetical protein
MVDEMGNKPGGFIQLVVASDKVWLGLAKLKGGRWQP